MDILKILSLYIDEEYLLFTKKIVISNYKMLGIRIPILKKIAKELLNQYNYQDILNNISNNTYEEVLLEGLIIAYGKIDYQDRLRLIDNYINKIDSWAICDTFVASLKFINKHKDEYLKCIEKYLKSKDEFILRFYVVCLLDYYIDDNHIDYVLDKTIKIKNKKYYVQMSISWLLSICLIKYFDKTKNYLSNNKNKYDKWVYNKALQKACESKRIKNDRKVILNKMKIK